MLRGALISAWVWAGLAAGPALATDPCAGYVPQVAPQNTGRDIVGQDLDQIVEQGYITFAVYENLPPYSWEQAGEPRGVDVEIARLIAEDLGVDARFDFVAPGENLEADLRNYVWKGPIIGGAVANVMMRVPYDSAFACRVEQVVFTGQYAGEAIGIAYREDVYPEGGPVPAYFRYDSVAVENDSISDFYLTSLTGGSTHIRRYPTAAAAMAALGAGEVGAAMAPLALLQFAAADGIAVHQPPLPGFSLGQWTLGVGVQFTHRPLAYAVDDAVLRALEDGRVTAIFERYGLRHLPPDR